MLCLSIRLSCGYSPCNADGTSPSMRGQPQKSLVHLLLAQFGFLTALRCVAEIPLNRRRPAYCTRGYSYLQYIVQLLVLLTEDHSTPLLKWRVWINALIGIDLDFATASPWALPFQCDGYEASLSCPFCKTRHFSTNGANESELFLVWTLQRSRRFLITRHRFGLYG